MSGPVRALLAHASLFVDFSRDMSVSIRRCPESGFGNFSMPEKKLTAESLPDIVFLGLCHVRNGDNSRTDSFRNGRQNPAFSDYARLLRGKRQGGGAAPT